jgi:hypothetical protein
MKTMTILVPVFRSGVLVLYCFTEMLSLEQAVKACELCERELGAVGVQGHNLKLDAMSASQVEHFEWFASRAEALNGGDVWGDKELICLTGAQAAEGLRRLKELDRLAQAPASLPS